ncbi:MAG: gamma-glutamyl-gamma-aminobutyrate hydrolase family protein [Clostridiales bacterium]|nr:gamma-glutamyl-gamma-aminobutyrate hydrolase family protein [Clostridiales bacterium]
MTIRSVILVTTGTKINRKGTREYRISERYIEMLCRAGLEPLLTFTAEESLINLASGLLLTGGGDIDPTLFREPLLFDNLDLDPSRDELELCLAKRFIQQKKPVFGICRGMQIINVALGGTLWQDLPGQLHTYHDETKHPVSVLEGTKLYKLFGKSILVNSTHHQAVKKAADGMIVSAESDDGVIEAIEHQHLPIMGVQWHPEVKTEQMPDMLPLFLEFIKGAEK